MLRINSLLPLLLALLLPLSGCVVVQENGTQKEKASKINVQLGISYFHQGNMEQANEKLVKALDQDPESSQAHHAYAVLQNRFQDKEKAEFHFRKAINYDAMNAEAFNNFGAFLCSDGRALEAEEMFMGALKNPVYRMPELAYTNAAVCLLKTGDEQRPKAKEYLSKAVGLNNNFRPALIKLAELTFSDQDFSTVRLLLERFHSTGEPTASSLWLAIQNELSMPAGKINRDSNIEKYAGQLKSNFPESKEYENWLALEK